MGMCCLTNVFFFQLFHDNKISLSEFLSTTAKQEGLMFHFFMAIIRLISNFIGTIYNLDYIQDIIYFENYTYSQDNLILQEILQYVSQVIIA